MSQTTSTVVMVHCLREAITVAEVVYPIYCGFMTPRDLTRIAVAPAFHTDEHHEVIATDIMKPSAKNWQRPLDENHMEDIARTFNSHHDFMPNPVLLSKNANLSGGVSIAPHQVGNASTGMSTITLDPSEGPPLWIIDGQHRIAGLARSNLRDEKIPVVLLIDDPHGNVYSGPTLAKIFAQVTTQASPLKPLHNDWLKYAFRLDRYSTKPQMQKAMTTVAKLAATPQYSFGNSIIPNVFFDKIKFNDYLPVNDFRGTPYDCTELRDFVFNYYFNRSLQKGELSCDEVARQLAIAYHALISKSPAVSQDQHCIIGDAKHSLAVVRNGFIASCLRLLADVGVPKSWYDLFQALNFPNTDWNFEAWKVKLHGIDNTRSFDIALKVFFMLFEDARLPNGITTLDLYFRGNNAEIILETSKPTNSHRYSAKGGANLHPLNLNQTINVFQIKEDRFLRLSRTSPNVIVESVEDLGSPRTDPVMYEELTRVGGRKGVAIDTSKKSPLKLNFKIGLFGGNSRSCEVDITW